MKINSTLTKLTTSALIAILLTICPASFAAARTSNNTGSVAAAGYLDPDQTPKVRIHLQIPQLTGDQAIDVFSYDHLTLRVGTASVGGGITDKIQAGPVKVGKRIDCYTPMLHQLHLTGLHLKDLTLRWARFDPATQTEYLFYTIKLTDVTISAIHTNLPNQNDPARAPLGEIEEVSFTYAKIEMGCAGA